ncbi:MAG TPA: ATP-binding protein [Candidatus Binatia bacterium]|nr:ATP-binding protein [Candidatus Binatia bacterium]
MAKNSMTNADYDFLSGGGQMGALIRSKDWSSTPLGPVERWPRSLKTVIFLMLNSRYPMFVWWGRELINFYNDAYIPVLGARHPDALGRAASGIWAEIWDVVGAQAEIVMREGRATWNDSILLVMERYGYTEETYFTFSYSPAINDDGSVGGVFCACTEDTKRILGERRLRTLRALAEQGTRAKSAEEACAIAAATMRDNPYDLPFAMLYLLDASSAMALRSGTTIADTPAGPAAIELDSDGDDLWQFNRVIDSGETLVVDNFESIFGPGVQLPGGAWPEPARQAVVLPMASPGQTRPAGFLIAGINPRLLLDDDYRGFLELTAGHIATAIVNARAYDEARKRAEALAEIDRAKTVFFSNVSHEFRTPLTLILGPTEEMLSGNLGDTNDVQRAHLLTLRYNAIRLQKLVNTLLDYARIEAGRVEAVYEAVDIGLLTRELASTFHSAVHRAELLYIVNCPSLEEPVYIDRDMWEKIVLNLLSNALKFTFKGFIEVSLKSAGDRVALAVRDSGVGIPEDQLPHLSDRFHRVPGSRGRTQEGSGIGLALIQELIKLHGGTMQVESAVGMGTTFTIFIPKGFAHLPKERLSAARTLSSTALGAAPFVEEALRWLPDSDPAEPLSISAMSLSVTDAPRSVAAGSERILIADDNLEMRKYLQRLLERHWNVTVVENGARALEVVRSQQPDLVLSDVMMPDLDGFELLRQLRADKRMSTIPVILLSARAGEEAYIEGMNAGADDYVVKPFGARELIARVKALLDIARVRREAEERFRTMADSSPIMIWVTDAAGRTTFLNRTYLEYFAIAPSDIADFDWASSIHPDERDGYAAAFQTALRQRQTFHQRVRVRRFDGQWRWFESRGNPIFDDAGNMVGFIGSSPDITEIYETQQALQDLDRRKDEFLATLSHELRNPLAPIRNAVEILKTIAPATPMLDWSRNLIDQQVGYMARLMEDLLDLSRITRGKLELRKQRTDLRAVIHDALETARPLIEAGQHSLTVDLPTQSLLLDGDPVRLTQLFANLLNNAAKYTEPNGQIHLSATVSSESGMDGAREALVSIKDAGIGIEADLLAHLFEMFFQADAGTERRYGGLGIGLTLARSIVELHGGSIQASSEGPGKGSEFIVRLPLLRQKVQREFDLDKTINRAKAQAKRLSRRVLVVDDNPNQVASIAMLLNILGCVVETANDAASALEVLKDFVPEFALIDIGLPGVDGFELARRIRKLDEFKDVVLIAQTGWGREEDREESRLAGFDHHLTKPLDFKLLENILTPEWD